MQLADIAAMAATWHKAPPMRFVRHDELEAPGEALVGRVVHWDGHAGALSYDRSRDVGVLILDDGHGWALVSLEKGQLNTTVRHAIAMGSALGLTPGDPRFVMVLRYLGQDGKVKRYRATAGVLDDAGYEWWS